MRHRAYPVCRDAFPHLQTITCQLVVQHPGRHRHDDGTGKSYVWGKGWTPGTNWGFNTHGHPHSVND